MLRSKRQRYSLRRPAPSTLPVPQPLTQSGWDKWLPRLSHVAQFGLFLFTVGSLYFTVIPLYQKAVLEEAIAKREVELKLMNDRLAIAYRRLRTNAVRDFQMLAVPECAGLFKPPRAASSPEGTSNTKASRAELVFSVDIRKCLLKVAEDSTSLADLNAADRKQFDEELRKAVDRLEGKRQDAIKSYLQVPTELSDSEAQSLPADSVRVQVLEFTARIKGAEAARIERKRLAAEMKKETIGSAYERAVVAELQSLRKTTWRSEQP